MLFESDKEGYAVAPLVCNGTIRQIESENILLFDGQVITLIDPDGVDENGKPDRLEVEAKVSFDKINDCWCGEFIYSELKYRSDKTVT
jgi:hypothetical protein